MEILLSYVVMCLNCLCAYLKNGGHPPFIFSTAKVQNFFYICKLIRIFFYFFSDMLNFI